MNWSEILDRLKILGGLSEEQLAAMERRGAWRVQRRVGMLGIRGGGEKVHLLAINFGPGGLRAESPIRLKLQEPLTVRVNRPGKGEKAMHLDDARDQVTVKVVWCQKAQANYHVGLAFCGGQSENEQAAARFLLEDCGVTIKSPKEKRRAPRTNPGGLSGFYASRDGRMHQVTVLDLAIGGALLESQHPAESGSTVNVKIFLSRDQPALDCKATVVRVRAGNTPRTHAIGVSFTEVQKDHKDRLIKYLSRQLKTTPLDS
ncbi:MAG: PilZ domain-containing protein [Candidatus Xenobia bacterium]